MGWDITGQHEVAQDGVGRGAQRGRAPYGADRLRARPGAAGAVPAGGDTCCRAEQVLVKSQTPTRQKNPSATSSFTCKSIFFFVVSLQMFNILIKVSRFSFLSKSDFGYFSLPDPAAITAKQCDFF